VILVVLTAVLLKIQVFWDFTLCHLVTSYILKDSSDFIF